MIKALIFDLDDTLTNNAPLVKEATIRTLQKHGIKNPAVPQKFEKSFFGMKGIEICRLLTKHFPLSISAEQFNKERGDLFYTLLDNLTPMPGFQKLISFLHTSQYKKILATSSLRRFVDKKLGILGITDLFDVVVTGDKVKNGKPDPHIFLLAAQKAALAPEECVVIEDSDNGIIAAKKIRMKTIGVKNSMFDSHQDLLEADIVVNSLAEVPQAVKSLT